MKENQKLNTLQDQSPTVSKQQISKEKSTNFPRIIVSIFCFFVGIPLLVLPLIIMFLVLPQLSFLYSSLDIQAPNFLVIYVGMTLYAMLGIINIFLGIILLKHATFFKKALIVSTCSFFLTWAFVGFIIISVINPIYNVIYSINEAPSSTKTGIQPKSPKVTACPVSPNTTNWKKYETSNKEFSLMYPPEMLYFLGDYKSIAPTYTDYINVDKVGIYSSLISPENSAQFKNISRTEFHNPKSIVWTKGNMDDLAATWYPEVDISFDVPELITVGKNQFIKQMSKPNSNNGSVSVNDRYYEYYHWLASNNILKVMFVIDTTKHDKSACEKTFLQILSTFKFKE